MDGEESLTGQEHRVEMIVRDIVRYVHRETAKAGTPELESLILARVAEKLVGSMAIERQSAVTRAVLKG